MNENDIKIKEFLDRQYNIRNVKTELSLEKPDPLLIANKLNDEFAILLCALFAYGKAELIVKFLSTLDFSLLDASEENIRKNLKNIYYRFQNSEDIIQAFIALRRLKQEESLKEIFYSEYKKEHNLLEALDFAISKINKIISYKSRGFNFLFSGPFKRDKNKKIKFISNSPYKRWNMFLRWMVRKDEIDFGYWNNINKSDLKIPLDTHCFSISRKLNLLNRNTPDLYSAILLTNKLKEFDAEDPLKYDFVLYRIGQEKIIQLNTNTNK